MNTKIIGIKDFRSNISNYVEKARKGDKRYVVMNRNKPLFEIKPFEKNKELEEVFYDILKAKDDIKNNRLYSQKDILRDFA